MSSPLHPRDESVPAYCPRCRDGSINLSRKHLVFLQGLLDRPVATTIGRRDWVLSARPYIRRYRGDSPLDWILDHAIDSLPRGWVARRRCGRCMSYRLQASGRAILEGQVPARVSGRYPYQPRGRRGEA